MPAIHPGPKRKTRPTNIAFNEKNFSSRRLATPEGINLLAQTSRHIAHLDIQGLQTLSNAWKTLKSHIKQGEIGSSRDVSIKEINGAIASIDDLIAYRTEQLHKKVDKIKAGSKNAHLN